MADDLDADTATTKGVWVLHTAAKCGDHNEIQRILDGIGEDDIGTLHGALFCRVKLYEGQKPLNTCTLVPPRKFSSVFIFFSL